MFIRDTQRLADQSNREFVREVVDHVELAGFAVPAEDLASEFANSTALLISGSRCKSAVHEASQPPMVGAVQIGEHQPPPIDERPRRDLCLDEGERVAEIAVVARESFDVGITETTTCSVGSTRWGTGAKETWWWIATS